MGNRSLKDAFGGVRKEIGIRQKCKMRSQKWKCDEYLISSTPLSSRIYLSKGEPTIKDVVVDFF